ncbi:PHP domain-containing protein [Superficieibacter electus]|uniref:PHP domain-containing protein n=1 Tax=Superficieibacter electus TaxID=2022662 RepID=A0A2P5GQC4_9ENTR|nr:PHP domain-containing protein [Superficieibacter electus]POP45587.1 PHP domain-containing protein [Superficieibacter electus]POP48748.1 PHP domain-containing protein [Superficieibacter electus]
MQNIDLHVHSSWSDDADYSVSNLIKIAKTEQVSVLSVTDHNSSSSVEEAIYWGHQNNIHVLPGIEIDCSFGNNNYHLLGYGYRRHSSDFTDIEHNFNQLQQAATPIKLEKLKALGFFLNEEHLFSLAGDRVPQEEEMAELILEDERNAGHSLLVPYRKGNARGDMPLINFFWDFFGKGKPCHVEIAFPPLQEMVEVIRSNGGIPVIAHIGANVKSGHTDVISEMIKVGVMGVEVFSSYHDNDLRQQLYHYAQDRALLMTCGSDFHGKNKPKIRMGSCKLSLSESEKVNEFLEHVLLY